MDCDFDRAVSAYPCGGQKNKCGGAASINGSLGYDATTAHDGPRQGVERELGNTRTR